MWPVILAGARTYAPYIVFPVAVVVGTVGYFVEAHFSDRKTGQQQAPSTLDARRERKLTEAVTSDVNDLKENKCEMKPLVSALGIILSFLLGTTVLYLVSALLPPSNGKYVLSFPSNLEDLKKLANFLKDYKEDHKTSVLLLFCAAYLYKQTFAIPGSVFMNLLAGALFGLQNAVLITCSLTACGATLCFTLSKYFGRNIITHYFPDKIKVFEKKVRDNEDGLFFFLLCLRLFPMSPNWFLNMASPIIGIPITSFFPSVFIGLMPYNFICCQTGSILSEVTSLNDILSPNTMMKMTVVAACVALPGILIKVWKKGKKLS